MLETQVVQFVQLENLAFFLGSPQNKQKLVMYSSEHTLGYPEVVNIESCTGGNREGKLDLLLP